MVERVLFQMWEPFREHLIASHQFYVAEAKRRLLDQFTDESMKADADRYADEWLASRAQHFDPDRDDPASNYELAFDESVIFYERLDDLRNSTRLSIIAGMYHEWEKQLRDWLGREMGELRLGEHTHAAIWRAVIDDILDFLETWKWPIRERPYYASLNLCHLVVNVYKHGAGPSFRELKKSAPDLVGKSSDLPGFFISALDYTDLRVGDADLDRFSDAIIAFWQDVPENTFASQLTIMPKWLENAIKKDTNGADKKRKTGASA
jgi:hypothetical protein